MRHRHGASSKKRATKKKATAKANTKDGKTKSVTKRPSGKKVSKKKTVKKRATKKVAKKVAKKKATKKSTKKRARKSVKVKEPEGLFTQQRVDLFIGRIADCYMQYEAAPLCKISVKTIQRWLQKGRARRDEIEAWLCRFDERHENGETHADIVSELGECLQHDQWSQFIEAYEEAEIVAKEKMMRTVRIGAEEYPAIAQWWLERRYPKDFGRAAMRPLIGNNAGGNYEHADSAAGDEIAELSDAIAAFEERARATTDPQSAGPAKVQSAPA